MKHHRLVVFAFVLLACCPSLSRATWVTQNSGTTLPLHAVFFVDSLFGWAVGGLTNTGIILRTTNGGTTWMTAYSDTQSVFYGAWFTSRQTGWAVGGRDNYVVIDTTCQKILKTTDGGLTWQRQWNRNANTNWRNLYGVCFIGNTGWACVMGWEDSLGYIIKTTDGGNTWSNQAALPAASDPMDIQFLDASHGVCCGGFNWGYPYDNTDGIVRSTSDGGTTWSLRYTWRPGTAAVGYFDHVWMVDASRGWCAGWAGGAIVTEPGRVVTTYNGGTSWVLRNPAPLQTFESVYFPDTSWGWVGRWAGEILVTSDGGRTWQDDNSGKASIIYDIHGLSRTDAWAVCADGSILRYQGPSGAESQSPPVAGLPPQAQFRIIPNPITDFARAPGHEKESIALYDISGRKVGVYMGDRIGEGLAPGVYFLKIEDRGARPLRIVKVR